MRTYIFTFTSQSIIHIVQSDVRDDIDVPWSYLKAITQMTNTAQCT